MRRNRPGAVLGALVAVTLAVGGCTTVTTVTGASPPAGRPAPAAASTTTAAMSDQAPFLTADLMLEDALMTRAGYRIVSPRVYGTAAQWFSQCGPNPQTEEHLVGTTQEQWLLGRQDLLTEGALAFQRPDATAAMTMARARFTACAAFTDTRGSFRGVAALPWPRVVGVDDQLTWCQDAAAATGPVALCAALYRHGDVLVEFFSAAPTRADARLQLGIATAALQHRLGLVNPQAWPTTT